MLGSLPKALDIHGKRYKIRSDFRNILRVIEAFNDDALSDNEKAFVLLKRLYEDFDSIPADHITEAYQQAAWFLRCGQPEDEKDTPKTVYWLKDEALIFPAINKAAGTEVRLAKYMHWWTFMGFFQSIDSESTYGSILMLRQKRTKGKKFERWEQEYWNANRDLCEPERNAQAKDLNNTMQEIFKSLLGGED